MNPTVRAALHDARRRLEAMYGDQLVRVVLYGSQARDEAHRDSDVDVLVVLRGPFNLYAEMKRLTCLQLDLFEQYREDIAFQPFEEQVYEDHTHPLMMNVHAEGIEL